MNPKVTLNNKYNDFFYSLLDGVKSEVVFSSRPHSKKQDINRLCPVQYNSFLFYFYEAQN